MLLGAGWAARELSSEKSDLRRRLGGRTYHAKTWTDAQWDEATSACSRQITHQTNACFASTFCSCAVREHRTRGGGFREFMDLLPTTASQGRYDVPSDPCALAAANTCPSPR